MISPIMLPIIKNISPASLAEICSVQPMTEEVGETFSLKHCYSIGSEIPGEGDRRHVFAHGWERFYNNEWISESLWIKLKIKGV